VFSSTGIDMYYALVLGYQITGYDVLKNWALAGGDNFASIFDRKAKAFLQIAGADRIVIDTGLNLRRCCGPPMEAERRLWRTATSIPSSRSADPRRRLELPRRGA